MNQEMKLNKDHSAEPEDFEDDVLSEGEQNNYKKHLHPFNMSLNQEYLVDFDSQDMDFFDDFRKFKNLENFVHWECKK